jgi:hypothetical protein
MVQSAGESGDFLKTFQNIFSTTTKANMNKATKKAFSLSVVGIAASKEGKQSPVAAEVKIDFAAQLRAFGICKDAITLSHASARGKETGNLSFSCYFVSLSFYSRDSISACFRSESSQCCLSPESGHDFGVHLWRG